MILNKAALSEIRNDIEVLGFESFGSATRSFIDDIISGGDESKYMVLVTFKEKELAGYLIISMVCNEAEIIQIAVKKDCSRTGVATGLINEAFENCSKKSVNSVFLEVRVSNLAAVAFYEKNGFEKTGVRKNYYSAPIEDALIMHKKLCKGCL